MCFPLPAAGVAAIFLMGASSCEKRLPTRQVFHEEVDQTPSYVVSIHDMIKYQRGDMMEKELESFSGGTVCVNKNSYLHSRDIMKIGMVQRKSDPEFFDLIITLTDRGQKIWSALSVNMQRKREFQRTCFCDRRHVLPFFQAGAPDGQRDDHCHMWKVLSILQRQKDW